MEGGEGRCGFCLLGNSAGASQIGYALSFYGLGQIVDAAIMSGGPPHAAIARGCLKEPTFTYDLISSTTLDESWGYAGASDGPCSMHDPSWTNRWDQASLEVGGTYVLRHTRIRFIFVSGDPTVAPAHGQLYVEALQAAHTPMLKVQTIPGDAHTIQLLPNGRDALVTALIGS